MCPMRIVRFHLEPWQRCGSITPSPAPSPSIGLLSPHIVRRQRPASIEDFPNAAENTETLRLKTLKDQERKMKNRYPQSVKRLSTMCSDILAKLMVSLFNQFTLKSYTNSIFILASNICFTTG